MLRNSLGIFLFEWRCEGHSERYMHDDYVASGQFEFNDCSYYLMSAKINDFIIRTVL